MDSQKRIVVGNEVPLEIMELVLSYLPMLDLCRMRSVCKGWNELMSKSSFQDLHDRNAKDKEYIFMQKYEHKDDFITKLQCFSATFNFFDRVTEQWYSIPTPAELPRTCGCGNAIATQLLAMNNGLICELASCRGTEAHSSLILSDPIAKTRRALPTPPKCFAADDDIPFIVIVVDDVTLRYKVFLFNNLKRTATVATLPRAYVHDAFSQEWRIVENLPNNIADAIGFRNSVFALQIVSEDDKYDQVRLFSYQLEGDSFAEVWRMSFRGSLDIPQLFVNENRLFLSIWTDLDEAIPIPPYECPNSETLFPIYQCDDDSFFEIYEILIAEGGRKPVAQFSSDQLVEIFDDFMVVCGSGYPCYDSNGKCNSVVLTNSFRGELRRYHMETGLVDVLPPSPLAQSIPQIEGIVLNFPAKSMKLSLRNLLQQCPTISMGWKLLQ